MSRQQGKFRLSELEGRIAVITVRGKFRYRMGFGKIRGA